MEMNVPKSKQTFDVEYKFYNDNKVVECLVTPKREHEFLWAHLNFYKNYVSARDAAEECSGENHFWSGKAVLKSGDTMDIETAKGVARRKAMRSYYNEVKWRYREVWEKIARIAAERLAYIENVEAKASDLTLEIIEMTKEGK
jgi:hypothetical protein